MILMDIKLDNLFAFNDFHLNLSYPKKIVHSSIENEHLKNLPNFRYKKVNILMGSNATGKTSLGKVLMHIFNFMRLPLPTSIISRVRDKKKNASFSMDFVHKGVELYRIYALLEPRENEDEMEVAKLELYKTKILKNDSYESCKERLDTKAEKYVVDFSECPIFGWYFTYPKDDNAARDIEIKDFEDELYLKILKTVLMTLDSSITDIIKMEDIEDAYVIVLGKQRLVMQKDSLAVNNVLSSGTLAGIDIAKMIYAIIQHKNEFYYCDEKFSYIHSDIERAILSLMISKLGDNEQLFFTTHNLEIADMNLPKHSFTLLKKRIIDEKSDIQVIPASKILKKASDSLKQAIDNDLFGSAPDISRLNELDELEA